MKKLSLLLVVLLAAGSAGLYGQMAIGTNFTIAGDATATVGYDIDDEQFGFKNAFSSNIKLELVPKGKSTHPEEAMAGWHASIELKDFKIVIDPDHDDSHLHLTPSEIGFIVDVAQGRQTQLATIVKDDPEALVAFEKIVAIYLDPTKYRDGVITNGPSGLPNLTAAAVKEVEALETTIVSELGDNFTEHNHGLLITEPTVVATLKNGPLWLQIFDAPANKADLIAHVENDEDGDNPAESNDDGKDVGLDLAGQGITVGYKTDDLSLAVGITSDESYDSKLKGSFAVSAELGVNVGPAELDLSFVQAIPNDEDAKPAMNDDTGIGVLLTTDFGDVELSAGADVHLTGDSDVATTDTNESMDWDAGGSATVALTGSTSLKSNFIYSSKADAATDVEVVLSDKNGLVQDLSLDLTWGLFDITGGDDTPGAAADRNDKSDLFLSADLAYALAVGDDMGDDMGDDKMMMKGPTLTPGTKITINQLDGGDATVGLEVRALLEHAIPQTTFGLKWATSQLIDTDTTAAKQGTITLWSKIKY